MQSQKLDVAQLGTRLRQKRRRMSLTLQELGAKSGVSVGYLSQVERGNATPTLGTLEQIATALQVGVEFFIATPKAADSLTRSGKRQMFSVSGKSITYERIGAEFPGQELTSFIMHVPPGYQSEEVCHDGEEILYMLQGSVSQVVDGHEYVLNPGDSLHYLGTSPHSWSNPTDKPASILFVGRMHYENSGKVNPSIAAEKSVLIQADTLSSNDE